MYFTTLFSVLALATTLVALAKSYLNRGGTYTTLLNCLNNLQGSVSTSLCSGRLNNQCYNLIRDY